MLTTIKKTLLPLNSEDYMVDICVTTYNHERYIADALNGLIKQKTNFKFRILVGEDCSTDNTSSILQQFALEYPNIIFPYFRKKNLGSHENSRTLIMECTSKYMALLDGDDYWTDNMKLQKQVDFLETNSDFSFCYHHVKIVQENGFVNEKLEMKKEQPEISTIENILKLNIWPHINSILFRRENMPKYPDWLKDCPSADWGIWLLITGNKKIKYMHETMSVYRQHSEGFWSSNTKSQNALRTLKSAKTLKKNIVKGKLRQHLYLPIHYSYIELLSYYRYTNKLKFIYYFIQSKLLDIQYSSKVKIDMVAGLSKRELIKKTVKSIKRKLRISI